MMKMKKMMMKMMKRAKRVVGQMVVALVVQAWID